MSSCTSPKIAFNENDLVELEWVFDSVCSSLRATGGLDEDTKGDLRRRIFRLACNGMKDPEMLRDHLVAMSEPKRYRASFLTEDSNGSCETITRNQ